MQSCEIRKIPIVKPLLSKRCQLPWISHVTRMSQERLASPTGSTHRNAGSRGQSRTRWDDYIFNL